MNNIASNIPAGFWRRVAAFFLDTFGIYLLFVVLMSPVRSKYPEAMPAIAVTFLIVLAVYFLFRDATVVGSIGKRLFSIVTVTVKNSETDQCTLWQSFLRNILFIIPLYTPIELLTMFIRKDKKRTGDLMAGTRVVLIKKTK